MPITKTSKEEILVHSIKLFKKNGYYNTSMSDIAKACGLIKGSIYHHFKSKDEIGLEALKYINKYFKDNIFSIASDSSLSSLKRLEKIVEKTDGYFLNSDGGCLLGNLALELSSENKVFKDEIRDYFTAWTECISEVLYSKFKNEANAYAKSYVAQVQGEIMMMNLYGLEDNYLKIGKKLISLLR